MDAVVPHRNLACRCGCSVRRCPDLAGDGGVPLEAGLRSICKVRVMLYNINIL